MKRLTLLFLFLFLSCYQDRSEVLFTIGQESVRLSEYQRRYGDTIIDKARFDELLEKKLFALKGKALNLDQDSAVIRGLDVYRKGILLEFLYDEVVNKRVRIQPDKIKNFYNKIKDQYHLAQIVVNDEASAQMVYQKITKNEPFETLAVKYSIDDNSKMYGGNIGFQAVQSINPEIYQRIKDLPDGGTTKPFPFQGKFLIVKVIEHKEADLPPFDQVQEEIKKRLEVEQKNQLACEFIDWIFKKAAIEYNPRGLEVIIKPDSELTPGDLEEWLVKKYKNKIVKVRTLRPTIKRLYDLYGFDPKMLVQRELQTDLLCDEALRRNIDRKREFILKIKDGQEELISQKFYDQEVLSQIRIDSAEINAYYQEHKSEFKKPLKDSWSEIWTMLWTQKVASTRVKLLNELKNEYPIKLSEKILAKLPKE